MKALIKAAERMRPAGDPRVIEAGPSVRPAGDQLARALGWFSIALGLTELLAPRRVTRALGVTGREGFVRACGAREIGAGMLSLSTERRMGLWNRVGGDAIDLLALARAMRTSSRRGAVAGAFALVMGITLLDLAGAREQSARRRRRGQLRDYRDRSGFPQGLERARGAAREPGAGAGALRRPAEPRLPPLTAPH